MIPAILAIGLLAKLPMHETMLYRMPNKQQNGSSPSSQPIGQISPKRIIYLQNGSVLFIENVPGAKNLVVHLDVSARGEQDQTDNGARHLMEHLCVLGSTGTLDERLELQGAFLTANTLRNGLNIEIAAKPGDLGLCINALNEIANPAISQKLPWWTQSDLEREKKIINQEIVLEESPQILSDGAWLVAFGQGCQSPLGDPAKLNSITLSDEQILYRKSFQANHLCLDIEGPVDVEKVAEAGQKFLNQFKNLNETDNWIPNQPLPKINRSVEADATGSARAAIAPGIFDPKCAAEIAAGLALVSTIHGGFLEYSPSISNGVIVIGSSLKGEIESAIDSYSDDQLPSLFNLGKALAKRYVEQESDPARPGAYWRAYLLSQSPGARPSILLNRINNMTVQDFVAAAKAFQKDHGITVEGSN